MCLKSVALTTRVSTVAWQRRRLSTRPGIVVEGGVQTRVFCLRTRHIDECVLDAHEPAANPRSSFIRSVKSPTVWTAGSYVGSKASSAAPTAWVAAMSEAI